MKHRITALAALAFVAACGVDSPTGPAMGPEVLAPSFSHVAGHGGAWTSAGPGTINVVSDAAASDSATMTYALSGSAVWSTQTWRFNSTAATSGPLTLAYTYSGYHAWFQVRVFARAFITRAGNTTYYPLVSAGPVNCCSAPSGGFAYSGNQTFNLQAGDVFGFEFGGSNGDSDSRLLGTFTARYPATPKVFTSSSHVMTWDPIFPSAAYANWGTTVCTNQPLVGLDANWVNPHNAFVPTTNDNEPWSNPYVHPWASSYFAAPWINAWNDLGSDGPGGHSWTRYTTPISGNGTFVLQLLADNCSWIYIDDELVGVQNTDLSQNTYSVTLSGQHQLTFIIFDGGGAAGGKFRIETYDSYLDEGGDPGDILPPPVVDNTPPVITPNVVGTLNGDWYTSNVSVSWTVTDAESAISSTTECGATSVTSDTQGVTFTCSATSLGGTASESVTIKRDATPPAVAPTVSGTMGNNGWYTSDVTVSWTVTESTSPVTSSGCSASGVTADTNGATFTCSATSAGGTTTESVTVKRDATVPAISFSGNAGSYTVDQAIAISCSATDAMSGIASSTCPGAAGDAYTFPLGSSTLSASATDVAGLTSSASAAFTVSVTSGSICNLVRRWVSNAGVANSMCQQLANRAYGAFVNHVQSQSGKKFLAADKAAILISLAGKL